jgi:hypothetical protein
MMGISVNEAFDAREHVVTKLIVRTAEAQIKVEVTPVLRGCVYEPAMTAVPPAVEDAFGHAEMQVVSFADLYAGKLVAAFDRQHPRDLFDVRDLLANEGVTDRLRTAFVVYLLSHGRPMAEILAPHPKDMAHEFAHGFDGMTAAAVTLDDLVQAREDMIHAVVHAMPEDHRRFPASFERGEPEWARLDVDAVKDLPAVRWRQHNLDKLSAQRRAALAARLESVLARLS